MFISSCFLSCLITTFTYSLNKISLQNNVYSQMFISQVLFLLTIIIVIIYYSNCALVLKISQMEIEVCVYSL